MHTLGLGISYIAIILDELLVLRGSRNRVFRQFPLFYSYIVYTFCASVGMYIVYWADFRAYASAYWLCYLLTILAEFMVLVEISDQIFRPFPAIRYLGRAITIAISVVFGLVYILPVIIESKQRRPALFDFALRASVTKLFILAALFWMARHYGSKLGKNLGGVMLGFSIYLAMNIAALTVGKTFSPAVGGGIVWVVPPLSSAICLAVWTGSLWDLVPEPTLDSASPLTGRDSEAVALELGRFNDELSKLLHK